MKLLEFVDVNKSFGEKKVLSDVSFSIPSGRIVGLLGKNGVGKSTIIKLINDLLTPDSGEILFKGEKIGVESKRKIAFLPERTYLDKSMTVSSVIDYFSDFFIDSLTPTKTQKAASNFGSVTFAYKCCNGSQFIQKLPHHFGNINIY